MIVTKNIGPSGIPFVLDTNIKHENLYNNGFYESEESLYLNILSEISKPVVFDVGSNIGYMSAFFRSCGATVHAFEPVEHIYNKSTERLKDIDNIKVNKVALSDRRDILKIYVSVLHEQGSTLKESIKEKFKPIFKDIEEYVQAITLDEYCVDNNIEEIDLLKIDVEGSEHDVLVGSVSMLKDKRIKTIVFEGYEGLAQDIIFLLDSYGYKSELLQELKIPMYISKPIL